ncbi:7962_t:CDS:2, partial [Diversispora eburnea]
MTTTMMIDSNLSTSINLTKEEWQAIDELIIILEDFAKATEYLSGSKYITISLMYSILEIISQKLLPEIVDLSNSNIAFDDNISYNDVSEDDNELITGRKITYQNIKNLTNDNQEIEYSLVKSNSFLARMFQNNNNIEE